MRMLACRVCGGPAWTPVDMGPTPGLLCRVCRRLCLSADHRRALRAGGHNVANPREYCYVCEAWYYITTGRPAWA